MTRDDIVRMAREAGGGPTPPDFLIPVFERFAKLVAEHEREACAKMCEEYAIGLERNYSEIIADKIRARGDGK